MSKEARRQAEARKKHRQVKLAKSAIIGTCVAITPLLLYLALRI